MTNQKEHIRRGLPRVSGADPWPPAGDLSSASSRGLCTAAHFPPKESAPSSETTFSTPITPVNAGTPTPLRRGLPRTITGEPWPVVDVTDAAADVAALATESLTATESAILSVGGPASNAKSAAGETIRQGIPRKVGGSPWPPVRAITQVVDHEPVDPVQVAQIPELVQVKSLVSSRESTAIQENISATTTVNDRFVQKIPVAKGPNKALPDRLFSIDTLKSGKAIGLLMAGAIVAAALLVLVARGITTLPGIPQFLDRFPGEYHLPETVDAGFPWWAQWTHFLNFFLMVLIIRSGYQVRTQQKPPAYWTPRRGGKKISLTLWIHQILDMFWMLNGLVFVVLLFVSGHWMRIVPSSWEVLPNAVSAMLQYMTLDWPVENGWVNYNSLQQLMYFAVVFIAAPLAALTGLRMSALWPKNSKILNRVYPVEVARMIHFPTMLFFVLFIVIHVFLVFSTGALRNLNHMYGGSDVVNWTGFWLFAAAIATTMLAWIAVRPVFVVPIAKLAGTISSR